MFFPQQGVPRACTYKNQLSLELSYNPTAFSKTDLMTVLILIKKFVWVEYYRETWQLQKKCLTVKPNFWVPRHSLMSQAIIKITYYCSRSAVYNDEGKPRAGACNKPTNTVYVKACFKNTSWCYGYSSGHTLTGLICHRFSHRFCFKFGVLNACTLNWKWNLDKCLILTYLRC